MADGYRIEYGFEKRAHGRGENNSSDNNNKLDHGILSPCAVWQDWEGFIFLFKHKLFFVKMFAMWGTTSVEVRLLVRSKVFSLAKCV